MTKAEHLECRRGGGVVAVTQAERIAVSNLVEMPLRFSLDDLVDYEDWVEKAIATKGPWLEKNVGKQLIDWRLISTGYIWFKRKEDKMLYILTWE